MESEAVHTYTLVASFGGSHHLRCETCDKEVTSGVGGYHVVRRDGVILNGDQTVKHRWQSGVILDAIEVA